MSRILFDAAARQRRVEGVLYDLRDEQVEMEKLINATRSGERRNKLTEANIHITAAISVLQVALKEADND